MREVVIVSAARTAVGGFQGALSGIPATDLGGYAIVEAMKRAGISSEDVDEVIMGQVLPCGYGQNPAKQAAVKAGMPWAAECITVNKVCGSALKTVMLAAQAIQCGDAEVVVAPGVVTVRNDKGFRSNALDGRQLFWGGPTLDCAGDVVGVATSWYDDQLVAGAAVVSVPASSPSPQATMIMAKTVSNASHRILAS